MSSAFSGSILCSHELQPNYFRYDLKRAAEKRFSSLEENRETILVESGHPLGALLESYLESGDELLVSLTSFEYNKDVIRERAEQQGFSFTLIDLSHKFNLVEAITKRTKAIYLESIDSNLKIPDWKIIKETAKEYGIAIIVDNTLLTSLVFNPFEWGADFVIYSSLNFTKSLSTELTSPKPIFSKGNGCQRAVKSSLDSALPTNEVSFNSGEYGFIVCAKDKKINDIGIRNSSKDSNDLLSKMNYVLLLQDLEYFSLKIEKQNSNALELAEFLARRKRLTQVNYPGLGFDKNFEQACTYLKNGFGNKLSFSFEEEKDAQKFINKLLASKSSEVGSGDLFHNSTSLFEIANINNKLWITLTVGLDISEVYNSLRELK